MEFWIFHIGERDQFYGGSHLGLQFVFILCHDLYTAMQSSYVVERITGVSHLPLGLE